MSAFKPENRFSRRIDECCERLVLSALGEEGELPLCAVPPPVFASPAATSPCRSVVFSSCHVEEWHPVAGSLPSGIAVVWRFYPPWRLREVDCWYTHAHADRPPPLSPPSPPKAETIRHLCDSAMHEQQGQPSAMMSMPPFFWKAENIHFLFFAN